MQHVPVINVVQSSSVLPSAFSEVGIQSIFRVQIREEPDGEGWVDHKRRPHGEHLGPPGRQRDQGR